MEFLTLPSLIPDSGRRHAVRTQELAQQLPYGKEVASGLQNEMGGLALSLAAQKCRVIVLASPGTAGAHSRRTTSILV